ncbi:MAG: TonB-dependent receptor [Pseudomonadota bacterium]
MRTQVIERADVQKQVVYSTSLLDTVSQYATSFSPARQKLTGRGDESFRGREPLYLIDGVPQSLTFPTAFAEFFGGRSGFTIDPSVIERVEILYGANALHGVGATGGVINYVTLSPATEDRWRARFEADIRFDDSVVGDSMSYRVGGTLMRDFGAVDIVASAVGNWRGAYYDGEDRRVGADLIGGEIQDASTSNFFVKAGYEPDPLTRLQVTANIYDFSASADFMDDPIFGVFVPVDSTLTDTDNKAAENRVRMISSTLTRNNAFGGLLTLQGFYQDFEAVYGEFESAFFGPGFFPVVFVGDAIRGPQGAFDQPIASSEKIGAKLTYSRGNLGVGGLSATGGVDFLHDRAAATLGETDRAFSPDMRYMSIAPFLQLDQQFFDGRVNITLGGRNEFIELRVDDFETLPIFGSQRPRASDLYISEFLVNAGGAFEIVDGLRLYASYSEGFELPDIERFLSTFSQNDLFFFGFNPDRNRPVDAFLWLDPIVVNNTEIGMKFDHDVFSADVSYFWSNSDVSRTFGQGFVQVGPDPLLDFVSLPFALFPQRTEISGIEGTIEVRLTNGVQVGGSLSILRDDFFVGDPTSFRPPSLEFPRDLSGREISPNRLNFFVTAKPSDNLDLQIQTSTAFDRTVYNQVEFDGYTLVDASVGYRLAEPYGRIQLGAQNLLDETYDTYFATTAPNLADGNYFAGRGRVMTFRWSADF